MSWFDATGFANLAKSALKEAQKTIDKALDIKEDDQGQQILPISDPSSPTDDTEAFFDNWGLKSSVAGRKSNTNELPDHVLHSSIASGKELQKEGAQKGEGKMAISTSLWGSFTGSFFESSSGGEESKSQDFDAAGKPTKKLLFFRSSSDGHEASATGSEKAESSGHMKTGWEQVDLFKQVDAEEGCLCDDSSEFGGEEGFSRSKLVVESEDGDTDARSRLSSCEAEEHGDDRIAKLDVESNLSVEETEGVEPSGCEDIYVPLEPVRRREHSTSSYKYNRLSVISSESDKKSSESVEVIGCGSGFTTSPDSPMSPGFSGTSSNFRLSVAASTPESVEVIPDTPSSVEVICDTSSGRTSRTTSSPYVSPTGPDHPKTLGLNLTSHLDKPDSSFDKISPESVEVIAEEEENEEEMSAADDSYASASESTATGTLTIMEQPHLMLVKSDTVESIRSLKSPHHKVHFIETPTKSGLSHSGMMDSYSEHLNISEEPVLTHGNRANLSLQLIQPQEVLRVSDLVSDSQDKLKVSVSSNEDSLILDSRMSDTKTLVATDSSCEGTNMESSSDDTIDTAVMEESSTERASGSKSSEQSSSYYVKTMLADAMGEEDLRQSLVPRRDHSPISSESRSDMVKVESEQTSGHTSGDEIETATSSDIEIISSPNGGDSSSTQSARHSPAKLLQQATRGKLVLVTDRSESPGSDLLVKIGGKVKGHQRDSSETSSGGSDDSHSSEIEKLMKRIADMTEILEVRESKLIDMSRINVDLQESNSELKSQLEAAMLSHVGTQDVQKINEEFTQRLSSLERKFQQAVREKETLRKQLEQSKTEAASRLSLAELEILVQEKDEIINDLRREGEKLSKQELQHSNIIKKLRAKEKESDSVIKNQKDQLEELNQEVERLKRSLAAKEDVERSQIEAVHQLTAKTKRQEKELILIKSQLDDTNQKLISLNMSLEEVNRELNESRQATAAKEKELKEATLSTELSVRQELVSALEEEQQRAQHERDELSARVDDLQARLRQAQEEHSGREGNVRQECTDLLRRLEQAEARNEELAQSVSVVTRPLLRQIESLQAAHSTQQTAWERQEKVLTETISELQGKLSSLTEQERSSREQCVSLRSQVSVIESKLMVSNQEAVQLRDEMENLRAQCSQLKSAKEKGLSENRSLHQSMKEQIKELKREVTTLEQTLLVEKAAIDAEKRKNLQLQEQLRERDVERGERQGDAATPHSNSPTLSFGRASLSESISSAIWPQFQDDAFECASASGRYTNVYDSLRSGNTTSLLECLQSQLKLRDGEMQQLQWEMSRRDAERTALTTELSQLTARVEDQEAKLEEMVILKGQYDDVQRKYDALLQMYGEKVEETQELRLDLEDVKEMYKQQIDQLLKKEATQVDTSD